MDTNLEQNKFLLAFKTLLALVRLPICQANHGLREKLRNLTILSILSIMARFPNPLTFQVRWGPCLADPSPHKFKSNPPLNQLQCFPLIALRQSYH